MLLPSSSAGPGRCRLTVSLGSLQPARDSLPDIDQSLGLRAPLTDATRQQRALGNPVAIFTWREDNSAHLPPPWWEG